VGGFYSLLRVESSYKDLNICGLLRFAEYVSVTLTYSRLETGGEAFHLFSILVCSALARSYSGLRLGSALTNDDVLLIRG